MPPCLLLASWEVSDTLWALEFHLYLGQMDATLGHVCTSVHMFSGCGRWLVEGLEGPGGQWAQSCWPMEAQCGSQGAQLQMRGLLLSWRPWLLI